MTRWQPTATPGTLRQRARLLALVRAHFDATGALEVETPALGTACVTDVHLASVTATVLGRRHYLHTSPEYAMKRLLAAGHGDLWQVARVFRDGESGRHHLPEFTLVEWYRVGIDHHALMDDVDALVSRALAATRRMQPAERITYGDAVALHAGFDPFTATTAVIRARLAAAGIDVPSGLDDDRDAMLDLVMGTLVGPELGADRLTFVHDYPASQAALARVHGPVASRFELYLDGLELANGFHELRHAPEQRRRFVADQQARAARGLPAAPIDEAFLSALESGLPDCSGVALGFDRLVMCALGLAHIDEAVAFGFDPG